MLSSAVLVPTLAVLAAIGNLGSTVSATPAPVPAVKRDDGITDTQILTFAAVLEDLEKEFYARYLNQYDATAFKSAGYPDWVRPRVQQIGAHEAQHSDFLRAALGSSAPPKCNYTFPVTSVDSFMALASVIESVGVSAYLGAAADIDNPAYVTVAGSILTVEARHQGWLNAAVLKEAAWSAPYDTPLSYSPVFSIASAFITGCDQPLTLPFTAFPALTIDMSSGALTYDKPSDSYFVAVYSGLDAKTFPISGGRVQLPKLQGFAYALVVNTNNISAVEDSNTIAGPYIAEVPFSSKVENPPATY